MTLDSSREVVALVGGIVAIFAAGFGGYVKWVRPKVLRAEAVTDAMLGRPEVADRSGAIIQPAQPGMPARMAELTDAVNTLVKMQTRVDDVEQAHKDLARRVDDHDLQLEEIRQARVEHVMSRLDSASAFSAIEAVAKSTPPDDED